jgi:excisionase family DNA binding protein
MEKLNLKLPEDPGKYLSPKEVSELLRVSKPFPYLLIKRGLIPFYKMGKVVRFKLTDIEDYLERCRIERKERD